MAENKLCAKCGKMLKEETNFYTYKNGEKTDMCKACLTMHIDNFDSSTFLWLLEKMDVPYIPEEWNVIRDRAYAKNPNLNGMSVFGKYLSKMKLKQWQNYGWADSEKLAAENAERRAVNLEERKQFEAEIKEKYEKGEIGKAEYETLVSTETLNADYMEKGISQPPVFPQDKFFSENTALVEQEVQGLINELTSDDKKAMAMKWGTLYTPQEWIALEQKYQEMTKSFDIQDADTINTLILICKTDLKMNQYIDAGDVEGFQKISKVSESLRKSAKFTAAQNKEQKNDFVDSVGELVAMCERDGFIPRYATDIPQDKVDLTLKDMKDYLYKLVTQDLGFGQQIEDALKKIQIQKEMEETEDDYQLTDEDYEDFYDDINEQKIEDETLERDE